MTALQVVVLAAVQGITEFLPVSSSAHFLLVPWLLGWEIRPEFALALSTFDQLGALFALLGFFWMDLRALARAGVLSLSSRSPGKPQAQMVWRVAVATLPALALGLFPMPSANVFLSRPAILGGIMVGTGMFLLLADRLGGPSRTVLQIRWRDAIGVGMAQAIGQLPGVSRSGAALGTARLCGLSRPASARLSFWIAVPVLLERVILGMKDLVRLPNVRSDLMLGGAGFVVAAVLGYFAIGWLLRHLTTHTLRGFAAYCLVLGLIVIWFSFLR